MRTEPPRLVHDGSIWPAEKQFGQKLMQVEHDPDELCARQRISTQRGNHLTFSLQSFIPPEEQRLRNPTVQGKCFCFQSFIGHVRIYFERE
jgi:hypothetical protein